MKMLRSITAVALAAAMLTGCAGKNTESGLEFSDSPFSNSSAPTSEPQADSYEELFGKYQMGSIRFGNYSPEGNSVIEYNGGSIEISFDMDTTGNQYEVEVGFMAFINGVPQKLSLNGGESSELVRVSQQPDQSSSATLSFTPTITEELSGEETLQLKIIDIFNPSFKLSGIYTSFGNAHKGQSFMELDIKNVSHLAVSDSVLEPIKGECESVLITDDIAKQYEIRKPGENTATMVIIKDAQTKEELLALRGGKLNAELLMYGSETYNYRVYVYVNHERVKFNGGDYLETETKSGHLNVLKLELENIKERDIIYAIAIPTNSDTGSMAVRKGDSVLVLDENNIPTDDPQPVESFPEAPPETSESENTHWQKNTNIYAYEPVEYIDDAQRYLLLKRHSYKPSNTGFYDYIIYDDVEKEITGTFEGDVTWLTYGNGVITPDFKSGSELYGDPTIPHFVVYNEKFEPINEIYDMDIFDLAYIPSKKCWYFTKDDGFYRANEDFSEATKLNDFGFTKYYVLEDKIVYYRRIRNSLDPTNDANIFGVIDLDGNVINETKLPPCGSESFRFGKAGDIIYLISWEQFDMSYFNSVPMDGMLFYNCKTGEQKMFHPENDNEKTFCDISPDGKYLVTGVLDMENHYTINDTTLKLYDLHTLELLDSKVLGTGDKWFLELSVYNDRALLNDGFSAVTYTFKSQ
ncbi:MAG: hypothetical protein K2J80_12020 [Oscillospiraceae bacterium]|nr:hypothetical protein [Oscillospiraceae bacterium]